jgi:hypothetical protein
MLRLAADENFNGDIVRKLLRRNPKLDIVRVQDVGLSGADDPSVLQWAADGELLEHQLPADLHIWATCGIPAARSSRPSCTRVSTVASRETERKVIVRSESYTGPACAR